MQTLKLKKTKGETFTLSKYKLNAVTNYDTKNNTSVTTKICADAETFRNGWYILFLVFAVSY